MLNTIIQFFSPPVFPYDEANTRLSRILHILTTSLLIAIALILFATLTIYVARGITLIILLAVLGIFLIVSVLNRRGYLRAGSLLFIFMLQGVATAVLYVGNGITGSHLVFYIALTVIAGILLGLRWAVVFAILNTLNVLALALLEINGYPFPRLFPEPPLTRWFNFSVTLLFTILPVYLILTSLSEALTRAQNENEQRKETERLLRESERKFRDITNNIPGLVFQYCVPEHDPGYFNYISPRGAELFGFSGDPKSLVNELETNVHNDDNPSFLASIKQAAADRSNWFYEGKLLNSQGDPMWVQGTASPISTTDGLVFNGVLLDITRNKQLEEQVLQSQKMEALGKMAGGVAHDLNNMLTPILMYVELVMMSITANSKAYSNLLQVKKAAERANGLTRQILAFSRRQVLEISVMDINTIVEDLEKMLTLVVGEDIELQCLLSPELYPVKADKGQIEQVLVNLALNARDAMPQGGKLIIETTNTFLDETVIEKEARIQTAGKYVVLAVSDTGHGMSEETKKRLFEPFFTTKEQGQGTGLGLSTVFGIIKQHNGYIFVYSEMGKGTTFKIYLPSTDDTKEEVTAENSNNTKFYGNETILVVEDEPLVRQLVCQLLPTFGYNVIEAESSEAGLSIASNFEETIHLLLTDVIMPQMNGLELYQKLIAIHPDLSVLYMSGYSDNVIFRENILDNQVTLLQKPFTTHSLLQKVRQVLG